jgi:hypothetical protein
MRTVGDTTAGNVRPVGMYPLGVTQPQPYDEIEQLRWGTSEQQ